MHNEVGKIVMGLKKIYESKLESDFLTRSIEKAVEQEIVRAKQEVKVLKRDLARLERKYNMRSEKFYRKFQAGALGDCADFFEWSALYQMYLKSKRRLEILERQH